MSLIVLDKETFAKGRIDLYPLSSVYTDNAKRIKNSLKLSITDYPRITYKVVAIELLKDKVYFYAPKLNFLPKAKSSDIQIDFPEKDKLTFHRISFSRQEVEEFFKKAGLSLDPSLENMSGELFLIFASDYRRNVYVSLRYYPEPIKDVKYVEFGLIELPQQEQSIEDSPAP